MTSVYPVRGMKKPTDRRRSYHHTFVAAFFCILLLTALPGCAKEPKTVQPFDPQRDAYLRASELIEAPDPKEAEQNPYDALSVPTYITKLDGLYFLVDCYHDQVLFHDNLDDPVLAWSVMTDDIRMGHTVASDGAVYLIDDTEKHRVLIMEKTAAADGSPYFLPTQEFTEVGVRPHYIIYDEVRDTFYVWSSMGGEMYLFRRDGGSNRVYLTETKQIPSLLGIYVRSFTIDGDDIYFVSGAQSILRADLDTFEIREEYPVPPEMAGMIQLTRIDDQYYITVSTDASGDQSYATILRTDDLKKLPTGGYEDVYDRFIGGGTPYYISKIDDRYYLTEHRLPGHSVWSFIVEDGEIADVRGVY